MKELFECLLGAWARVGRAGLLVVCLGSLALSASAANLVNQGSVINTAIMGGTNCYTFNPGTGTTNVAGTNGPIISVSGAAGPLAISYDIVADNAPGNTNNGIIRLVFAASLDEALFTTGTNAFSVDIVHTGTTRLIGTTNIAASILGGWSGVRWTQLATTNIGFFYITNLQYRVVQSTY
jgi:hypothetical protein